MLRHKRKTYFGDLHQFLYVLGKTLDEYVISDNEVAKLFNRVNDAKRIARAVIYLSMFFVCYYLDNDI